MMGMSREVAVAPKNESEESFFLGGGVSLYTIKGTNKNTYTNTSGIMKPILQRGDCQKACLMSVFFFLGAV